MKEIDNGNMTKKDFIEFMESLVNEFNTKPRKWENNNLELFLEAIVSWTEDMEGYYQNQNIPIPKNIDWSVFANILMGATMYE